MHVRAITIAVVLLLALMGAGCGGGDDEASGDTDTVLTDTTTDETTTDDDETTTDGSAFEAGDCSELVESYTELSNAFAAAGGTDVDLDEAQELFEGFADDGPDEIQDDLQVLAEAYAVYVEALGDIDLDAGEVPNAEDLAQLQQALASVSTAEVTEASANVSQWTTENC
jgi:hypothetical protein